METHEKYGVERRGQVVAPGGFSRRLRPMVGSLRGRIPDRWMRDYLYGPLSTQVRNRFVHTWEFALPATVSIETRTICNGRCSFCLAAVQNRVRPDKSMPWKIFAGIVDDLAAVDFTGRLAFFVNNEPLLDKGLEKKIAHARKLLPRAFFQVSTNGLVLTPERADALFNAGLDDLTVNNYADHHEQVRENISKTMQSLSPERRSKFIVYVREQEAKLFNRAGSAPNADEAMRPMRAFCQMPFTQINIVHDGTVSLCCQDLLVQEPIGNVTERGVWPVWFSNRYREIRRRLLDKDRTCTDLCRVCDYRGFKTLTGVLRPFNRLFNVLK